MYRIIIPLLIIFTELVFGQEFILKPNKKLVKAKEYRTIYNKQFESYELPTLEKTQVGLKDTLRYSDEDFFNNLFSFFSQDVMMQYFEAPADLVIMGAGFASAGNYYDNYTSTKIKLVKLNWSIEKLKNIKTPMYMGYYPSENDGFNNIDYFGDYATDPWVDSTKGDYPIPPWAHEQFNLYEFEGKIIPTGFGHHIFQFLYVSDSSNQVKIDSGEVFGVVLINEGITLGDEKITILSERNSETPGWKYYENGRFEDGSGKGWWVRDRTWDFGVVVDILGDLPPEISVITELKTTFKTNPRLIKSKVTDINPSGGDSGLEDVSLIYTIDSLDTIRVTMQPTEDDWYEGYIAEVPPCSFVEYWIEAKDVKNNFTESKHQNYKIFCNTEGVETLLIYNGSKEETAYEFAPEYVKDVVKEYDLWASYGPTDPELFNHYSTIIEISALNGPAEKNWDGYEEFLLTGNKVLAIVGQEILGYLSGYPDSIQYQMGDFQYDILGVEKGYNDVGEQIGKTAVLPLENSLYGDSLANWMTDSNIDSLWYDPGGLFGTDNWIDQFIPREDINSEIFLLSLSKDGFARPSGHSFVDENNNKIFFMSVDPYCFTTDSIWIGNSTISPLYQFLKENIIVKVNNENQIPNEFSLKQNYPNPFNPSTVIEYSVPKDVKRETENVKETFIPSGVEGERVQLKVYDILGREIATLVNENQKPGNYKISFPRHSGEGRNLSSGVYFYRLTHRDNIITKKMILLK